MKKLLSKNSGITLISMVITIIILIILSSISISIIMNGGIIDKAKFAKKEYLNAQVDEIEKIDSLTNEITVLGGENKEQTQDQDENDYVIVSEEAKKVIQKSEKKYSVNAITLFNDKEYVNNIIESEDNINYIIDNQNILNEAIESKYFMPTLLESSKSDYAIQKLIEKSTTNPELTSSTGSDGGYCFGTAPYPAFGYQIWNAFNLEEGRDYAYYGIGAYNLGYKFPNKVWCLQVSFKNRSSIEGIDNLKIQYSDDGTNWIDASEKNTAIRDKTTTQYCLATKSIGKHEYWRITGTGYGGNKCNGGIRNLRFHIIE